MFLILIFSFCTQFRNLGVGQPTNSAFRKHLKYEHALRVLFVRSVTKLCHTKNPQKMAQSACQELGTEVLLNHDECYRKATS